VAALAAALGQLGEDLAALGVTGTVERGPACIAGLLVEATFSAHQCSLEATLGEFLADPRLVCGGGPFVQAAVAGEDRAEQADRLVRVVGDAVAGCQPVGDELVEIFGGPAVAGGAGQQR
jgi:hypothetical protein